MERSPDPTVVRATEVIASLSLATDLAVGLPLEHGLRSTLVAMRLCDQLGVDQETAKQSYFLCLLFYVGCTAPADLGTEVFGDDDALVTYAAAVRFGSRPEMLKGWMQALAPPQGPWPTRVSQVARGLPRLLLGFPGVVAAVCELGEMLADSLGLGTSVSSLFRYESERWDGKGLPGETGEEDLPLPVRIVHVSRDAAFQSLLGDEDFVGSVIARRAGQAFDPAIARIFSEKAPEILDAAAADNPWDSVLEIEPGPGLTLEGERIDRALAAMGHFSDLGVSYLVGHSDGVAETASAAAQTMKLDPEDQATVRQAALIHDLGRVAVPVRIWEEPGPLTTDDWERVRLHAYHTERALARSSYLAGLSDVAISHHERLDGSGYHRALGASSLGHAARILAAADAYQAMIEPRPHRPALSEDEAAAELAAEARAGRLAPDAVAAVLEAAGQARPLIEHPAGLTERETQVVALLARGLQTKQVARALEISPKTADSHIQNAYRKMGVSTRAGATLFAVEHGLTTQENTR
jgi:HD-GYP domain-containing protein (c-di-GMP phosphodiesterase class II)